MPATNWFFYHESFHAYVQEGKNRWIEPEKDPDAGSSRGQVFPVVYNSRIYRKAHDTLAGQCAQ